MIGPMLPAFCQVLAQLGPFTLRKRQLDNFVATSGGVRCHCDNLHRSQQQQSCQIADLLFSVYGILFFRTHRIYWKIFRVPLVQNMQYSCMEWAMASDSMHWKRNKVLVWHDDVIKWKQFPCYWPFVCGIHLSPVNSVHKGPWRGALMFSLNWTWINGWGWWFETPSRLLWRHCNINLTSQELLEHPGDSLHNPGVENWSVFWKQEWHFITMTS